MQIKGWKFKHRVDICTEERWRKETLDIFNITCYQCEEKGHYIITCPKKERQESKIVPSLGMD